MAKMRILWRFMFWKDDVILNTLHFVLSLKKSLNPTLVNLKKRMKKLPKEGAGQSVFIILNGPSLKKQDLSILRGKNLMFVNRGFMHLEYKNLQPKYHLFEDTKMLNGQWPTDWFEEIWSLSPNTVIVTLIHALRNTAAMTRSFGCLGMFHSILLAWLVLVFLSLF